MKRYYLLCLDIRIIFIFMKCTQEWEPIEGTTYLQFLSHSHSGPGLPSLEQDFCDYWNL